MKEKNDVDDHLSGKKPSNRKLLDKRLLGILACPVCKGPLSYDKEHNEMICKVDALAFPVRDGIPVMLEDEARDMRSVIEGE
jgi:uncharacterized protein YbaR (Trm112 family)